jgi:integrase
VETWIAAEAVRLSSTPAGLAKKTLKRRLSALASLNTDLGADPSAVTNGRVERVIAGANRFHGNSTKPQPLPITLPILRKLLSTIRLRPFAYGGPADSKCLAAAFSLAFACFMRMGEFTFDAFDPRFDLQRAAIAYGDDGIMKITIPASKTDPFRSGVTVVIPSGPADVCPRVAIRTWLAVRTGGPSDPLFSLSGRGFSRSMVSRHLRRALADSGYVSHLFSGHSFRRGAATWAASIGIPGSEIKALGRWNSDCYKLYVDAGPIHAAAIGVDLLSAPISRSTLPTSGLPTAGDVWRPSLV